MNNKEIFSKIKKYFPESILCISEKFFINLLQNKYLEVDTPHEKEFLIIYLNKRDTKIIKLKLIYFFFQNPLILIKNFKKIIYSLWNKDNSNLYIDNKSIYMLYLVIETNIEKQQKYKIFNDSIKNFLLKNNYEKVFGQVLKSNERAIKFYKNNNFNIINKKFTKMLIFYKLLNQF